MQQYTSQLLVRTELMLLTCRGRRSETGYLFFSFLFVPGYTPGALTPVSSSDRAAHIDQYRNLYNLEMRMSATIHIITST